MQKRLAGRVRHTPLDRKPRLVAGLDCAFGREGAICIAGVVVWDASSREVVEERTVIRPVTFPYVPGLLSFREAPALLAVLRSLRCEPDALLVDGHGVAHPRRFGIACHVGVIADRPTAGCAKSRLVGEAREPGQKRGARRPLVDRGPRAQRANEPERIGTLLRTRDGTKPVFASVGHRIDLPGAEALVLDTGAGYRLPEPTRLADRLVARTKREIA